MLSLVNVSSFFTQSKGGAGGRARALFLFSRLEHAAGMLRLQKQELEVLNEQNLVFMGTFALKVPRKIISFCYSNFFLLLWAEMVLKGIPSTFVFFVLGARDTRSERRKRRILTRKRTWD